MPPEDKREGEEPEEEHRLRSRSPRRPSLSRRSPRRLRSRQRPRKRQKRKRERRLRSASTI